MLFFLFVLFVLSMVSARSGLIRSVPCQLSAVVRLQSLSRGMAGRRRAAAMREVHQMQVQYKGYLNMCRCIFFCYFLLFFGSVATTPWCLRQMIAMYPAAVFPHTHACAACCVILKQTILLALSSNLLAAVSRMDCS